MIIGYDYNGEELRWGDKVKMYWECCCYEGEEQGMIEYSDFEYKVNDVSLGNATEIYRI